MFFVICPQVFGGSFKSLGDGTRAFTDTQQQFIMLFQAGWFVESLWSQTLVIHMIRTPKLPFIQSRASLTLTVMTTLGIALGTVLPYVLGSMLGMHPMPGYYFGYLVATIILYMVLATVVKKLFVKRYKELL